MCHSKGDLNYEYGKININSMDYRKLSKEDKLKVVRFKINKLLSDTSSSKAYEYYNGKK